MDQSAGAVQKQHKYRVLTKLRPLKHLQLRMRIQQPLNCLNILFILKPRKHI